jgi:hypothetical protein
LEAVVAQATAEPSAGRAVSRDLRRSIGFGASPSMEWDKIQTAIKSEERQLEHLDELNLPG